MRVVPSRPGAFAMGGALDPQGPAARDIDALWWLLFWLGLAVFVVFAALLALSLFRGPRRRRPDEDAGLNPVARRRWLAIGGVAMPAVVLVIVLAATVETMADLQEDGTTDPVRIEIVGHQWWWEISYPDHDVTTANEIRIPVGRPVEFTLTSADVIHSFWVPQLGGKLDLLPEDENTLVLQADTPATYRSQCAEFCGLQHANMRFVVIAEPPDEYAAWLAAQAEPAADPTSELERTGQEVFLQATCVKCHAIRGANPTTTEQGPDLTHFAGRSAVSAALLPPEQLREWIADPQHFKEGTAMPAAELPDDDLDALVAYLESLR